MPNSIFGERWMALMKALIGTFKRAKNTEVARPHRIYNFEGSRANRYLEQALKQLSNTDPSFSKVVRETYTDPDTPIRNRFDMLRKFATDNRFTLEERIRMADAIGKPDEEELETIEKEEV